MSLVTEAAIVTNIEAANRQLRTAIHMFFADGDAVSVHTLATAAREIYEKHCARQGLGGLFDFCPRSANFDRRATWDAMNAARNFFKHPADSAHDGIAFDDTFNDSHIYLACMDCATLAPADYPAEADAFLLWSISTADVELKFEHVHPEDAAAARSLVLEMDRTLPGLRTAPRELKKRWGGELLRYVIANVMEGERSARHLRYHRQLLLASDSGLLVRLT